MLKKIIISLLIVLNIICMTTTTIFKSVQEKKEYVPYQGSAYDLLLIWLGPSWTILGQKGSWGEWIFSILDFPFSFVLDTILLPGTIPYYIYVKSDRSGSESRTKRWNKEIYTFRTQNPPYNVLRSVVRKKDPVALRKLLESLDVVALEKKIQRLQEEKLLPYEHPYIEADLKDVEYRTYPKEKWNYSWYKISILEYLPTTFYSSAPDVKLQSDRVEILNILYEQFQKDPVLEKQFYDKVWKACFSTEIFLYDPSVFKKVLHSFSDREKAIDLLDQRIFEENSITKDHKFWKDRVRFLLEFYKSIPKDQPHLDEKFRNNLWKKAIFSGVIVFYPPALEMAFRKFPEETRKSIRNLFWKASSYKDSPDTMNFIEQNIHESNEFASDRDTMRLTFRYPKILEKLLKVGLDPNQIFELKRNIKIDGKLTEVTEEESLLILCINTENEESSIESFRILLQRGTDPNLGVRKYDRDGKQYLFYPNDALEVYGIPPKIMQSKRKIWDDRKKVLKKF
ncbi:MULTISPECIES: YceK/YidQ family lipoprotein [Leptospira]|uniref:YceK/YidQ family lipoprotein n=2 Tax=Leptospira kirschneri TaxID=29507 RepID=A0A1T1DL91_9LEPT|nr:MULTISPECIES: YceK/YidQ family lipoprotein [Leptospira]EMK06415.1 PF07119 family protein [Leptospira kirschneri]KXZ20333.1 hypothetical protein AYB32_07360 [Leptospira kirschneri]KXZ25119.1 hypothetical protein AYB34_06245 [Leptospira sp. ZV016]OOV41668.1 YceK/YidQ family lipoprotein [Leptospira kirschneri serovar Pomona]